MHCDQVQRKLVPVPWVDGVLDNVNIETAPPVSDLVPESKASREVPDGSSSAEPPATVIFRKRYTVKGYVLAHVLLPLETKTSNNVLGCFGRSANVHCPCCDLNDPGLAVLDKEMAGDNYLGVYEVMCDVRLRLTLQHVHPNYLALN